MAAAPLPAARQMILPFGTGRRWAPRITSGCAAATAASKISRRRRRWSVMVSQRLGMEASDAGYPSYCRKRKPPQGASLARVYGLVSADRRMRSAAHVAGDDVAEQFPPLALEPLQLQLADRGEVGRRGIDGDAGQQDFGAEVLEVGRLLHDVCTGEVVVALLEHLDHCLRDAVADDDRVVELVAFRKILGQEIQELLHAGVIVPLRVGDILQIGR